MMTQHERDLHSAEGEWKLFQEKTDIDDVDRARTEWEYNHKMTRYSQFTIGFRLQQEREKSGLTQDEVAKALCVNRGTISDWETGKANITLRDAHRLMMLYRLIPGERTWETANLNDLTITPMEIIELARDEEVCA